MKMILASHNKGKIKEFKEILAKFNIEVISLADLNFHDEIIEDGTTFMENALIKAKTIYDLYKLPVPKFNITNFSEHSIGTGSDTCAIAYVQITKEDGTQVWGVGKSSSVGRAGIAAVVSALNFKA